MGKKKETFEAVLVRMKVNGPLLMREQLKLLTAAAVEGAGEKVTRNELLAAAHMVSKEATKTALAWSGEIEKEDALLLLNVLVQAVSAFVTVCHGFTAGAGQTLLAAIRATATAVVEAAAQLMEGCIDLVQNGAPKEEKASVLPKLAGRVWETCEAVKKAPTSNQVAVGRGLALLAATVKDTLREMGDMKETKKEGGEGSGRNDGTSQVESAADGSTEKADTGPGGAKGAGLGEAAVEKNDGMGAEFPNGGTSGASASGRSDHLGKDAADGLGEGLQHLRLSEFAPGGDAESSGQAKNAKLGTQLSEMLGKSSEEGGLGQAVEGCSGERSEGGQAKLEMETGKEAKPDQGGGTRSPQEGGKSKLPEREGSVSLPDDLGAEILDYNPEFDAEDMELVCAAVPVAEGVLELLKQLMYVVAKWAPPKDWSKDAALNVLEMLHGDCSDVCLQVEEVGACLYPPQEIDSLLERTTAIEEKVNNIDDIVHEAVEGSTGTDCKAAIARVLRACHDLRQLIAEGMGTGEDS